MLSGVTLTWGLVGTGSIVMMVTPSHISSVVKKTQNRASIPHFTIIPGYLYMLGSGGGRANVARVAFGGSPYYHHTLLLWTRLPSQSERP